MSSNTGGMDWNDQTISKLRTLWERGHSTAEIGRRMGASKNAIGARPIASTYPLAHRRSAAL